MLFRGLCVGINAYPSAPLHNCVYDAEDFAVALEKRYGFQRKNSAEVRLLCDGRATRSNIVERIDWLIRADVRVIYQSGHGAQIADRNGDEIDRLDELFCPVDFSWLYRETMLLDDDYAAMLRQGPRGAVTYFISDSCHSGDLARQVRTGVYKGQPKTIPMPVDIAWRNRHAREAGLPLRALSDEMPPGVVSLAACRSDQVSMDGAPGDGRGNGAFTWALLQVLDRDPSTPLNQVIEAVNRLLSVHGYSQQAQISGPANLITQPLRICEG